MLVKNCPKCKKLIPYGKTYCDKCEALRKAEREASRKEDNRRYNKQRDKKYEQFYNSSRWRVLSKKFLDKNPRCLFCGKIAAEVDHIEEIQTPSGWEKRYDWNNLRSLCTKCHNQRHGRFTKSKTPRGG